MASWDERAERWSRRQAEREQACVEIEQQMPIKDYCPVWKVNSQKLP